MYKNPWTRRLGRYRSLVVVAIMLAAGGAASASDSYTNNSSDWQFGLSLYLWVPSISGELKYTPPDTGDDAEVDIGQIIDAIQMVFMGSFSVRKGAWSGFTDLLYLDMAGDRSKSVSLPDGDSVKLADAELDFTAWVWTLAGAYTPWSSEISHVDVLVGARLLALDTGLKLSGMGSAQRELELSGSPRLWDGIVGVKGRFGINERWFIPYYADLGAGETDYTWQLSGGIGYSFGWGDVVLDYRHLQYGQSRDNLILKLALSGGRLGFVYRF